MGGSAQEVFEAKDPAELAERYDRWAPRYEAEMGDHAGPAEAALALARHIPPQARVLDVGCGTGLVGMHLAALGFSHVEGLDLSPGMLEVAGRKGCYQALYVGILGEALDLPDAAFDAAVAVGVFVRAHAPARALLELSRVVRPGGHVALVLRPEWRALSGIEAVMDALVAGGRWRLVEVTAPFSGRYQDFPEVDLQVWIHRVEEAP